MSMLALKNKYFPNYDLSILWLYKNEYAESTYFSCWETHAAQAGLDLQILLLHHLSGRITDMNAMPGSLFYNPIKLILFVWFLSFLGCRKFYLHMWFLKVIYVFYVKISEIE